MASPSPAQSDASSATLTLIKDGVLDILDIPSLDGSVSVPAAAPPAEAVSDAAVTAPADDIPEEAADSSDTSPQPPPPKETRICGVCNTQPGKYKCPRCPLSYCSVPCNKTHKENHPPSLPPSPTPTPAPSTSTLPLRPEPEDPYRVLLEHTPEIRRLFTKYPILPTELARIHRLTLPPVDTDEPPPSGLPWKLQPEHLGQPKQRAEPWTRQVGLRKGAAALKKARTDPGERGDAVREYCELVLFLLVRAREQKKADVGDVVRREVVAEETEVIRGLLARERE